jgi:hypothetical protein
MLCTPVPARSRHLKDAAGEIRRRPGLPALPTAAAGKQTVASRPVGAGPAGSAGGEIWAGVRGVCGSARSRRGRSLNDTVTFCSSRRWFYRACRDIEDRSASVSGGWVIERGHRCRASTTLIPAAYTVTCHCDDKRGRCAAQLRAVERAQSALDGVNRVPPPSRPPGYPPVPGPSARVATSSPGGPAAARTTVRRTGRP